MECIGFERLIDFLDGRVSAREKDLVEAHLRVGCSECRAGRLWYEGFKRLGAGLGTTEAPPWIIRRAERLFDIKRPSARVAGAAHSVAKLVFDSLKRPAPAGARSAAVPERQVLYWIENYSIDLQMVQTASASANLIGQVIDAEEAGFGSVAQAPVDLIYEGEPVRRTTTNEIGEFSIIGVDQHAYDLRIETRDIIINIVDLSVSATD
jgi:hypothetical protein